MVVLVLTMAGCSDDAVDGKATSPSATSATAAASASAAPAEPEPERTLPARWWAWAAGADADRHPVSDTTGACCAENQPDDVWFLAGTFGEEGVERTCTVPANRPVYFPLLNTFCTIDRGERAADALQDCALQGAEATATLDGVPLEAAVQTSGDRFRLAPGPGDALGLDRTRDAVAWGIWAGPRELTPGRHTVVISGTGQDFAVGVTYRLTVR